ncbi:MAG: Arc family DNA-binding protein [Cyanobacteria bacterium J06621_8]
MPSITIKNIPEALLQKIKESSVANHRSMNAEVIFRLQQVLASEQRQSLSLEKIRALRAKTKNYYLTSTELEAAINSNR